MKTKETEIDKEEEFKSWWNGFHYRFMVDSEYSIFHAFEHGLYHTMPMKLEEAWGLEWVGEGKDKKQVLGPIDLSKCLLFIVEESPLEAKHITQSFKEGITNCMLSPIKLWAERNLEEAKSKSSKSRNNVILNTLSEYEKISNNGIPENSISKLCTDLQVDITVQLPYCNTKFIEGKSTKKSIKHFKFLNTRIDHVELNEVTNMNNFVEKSKEEIDSIRTQLDDSKTFYYENTNKTTLYALNEIYKEKSVFNDTINEFEQINNMNEYAIDDISQPELSKFIAYGTHYNGTVDFMKNLSKIFILGI